MPLNLSVPGPALALLLGLASAQALAQQAPAASDPGGTYAPQSGDAWVDRHLVDMGGYAARYPDSFADELARYFDVPRGYVLAMLQQPGWEPGDIYMACALARRKAQPCRVLVRARAANDAGDGWQGVAERVAGDELQGGARSLREDISASYRRWARPLIEPPSARGRP